MFMTTAIIIGIIGAIISAVTGTLWYNDKTPMGKLHMRFLGFDKLSAAEKDALMAAAKPKMWKTYSLQMLLSFITSFFIGFVTWYTVYAGGPAEATYSYVVMIWLAFTVPMIGQNLLWANVDGSLAWKKFFSDAAYNLITYLIIAFVATLLV
ncbi:MAG: hypothetical protein RL150_311 [Candidatus Parcubacteria bacterium]